MMQSVRLLVCMTGYFWLHNAVYAPWFSLVCAYACFLWHYMLYSLACMVVGVLSVCVHVLSWWAAHGVHASMIP